MVSGDCNTVLSIIAISTTGPNFRVSGVEILNILPRFVFVQFLHLNLMDKDIF